MARLGLVVSCCYVRGFCLTVAAKRGAAEIAVVSVLSLRARRQRTRCLFRLFFNATPSAFALLIAAVFFVFNVYADFAVGLVG